MALDFLTNGSIIVDTSALTSLSWWEGLDRNGK